MGNGKSTRADIEPNNGIAGKQSTESVGDSGKSETRDDAAGNANSDGSKRGTGKSGSGGNRPGTVGKPGDGNSGSDGRNNGNGRDGNSGQKKNNRIVSPKEIAGDTDKYQTDKNGNIVLKADGTPALKRGRKAGSTNSETKTETKKQTSAKKDKSTGTEMLAAQFQILNTGIAFITRFDDFKLEDAEAMQMAEATANVLEQFDYTPDPKIAAVLGLVTTTSMIYGPRVYLYRKDLEKRAAKRKEPKQESEPARAQDQAIETDFPLADVPMGFN